MDALLRKLDHRVENLRNDLVLAQSQAEERQRVLVLQSEWQKLCMTRQGRNRTIEADAQPCPAPESEGMDDSDTQSVLQGDADGFLTVLSRKARRKHQSVSFGVDGGGRSDQPV